MKLKDLAKPITLNKHTWYYLDGRSAYIIHEVRDEDGTYHRTIQIRIPISHIEKWFINPQQNKKEKLK